MNLLLRINLALLLVFALAATALAYVSSSLLQDYGKQQALQQASLMMDSALAIRAYTSKEINPLLKGQMQDIFLPQSVPSYSATQNFLKVRENHPAYAYKEATLNPTNPRDRASDWEADIIQKFRNDQAQKELSGERDTPMGTSLYLARPIRAGAACLECHGAPNAAPSSLLTLYGSNNGFGWQRDEVIGAQIVSVPLSSAVDSANRLSSTMWKIMAATFVVTLAVLNAILYFVVVRPVRQLAGIADRVSLGDQTAPAIAITGSSEIALLARSFDRLRTSMDKALKMLEGP